MRVTADPIKELEQLGEDAVRMQFRNGNYKPPAYEIVREWLHSNASSRAVARSEENLSNSRKALRIAWLVIAIAVIAIAVATIIAWLQNEPYIIALHEGGSLRDLSPTLLAMLQIDQPGQMTGGNLALKA